MAGRGRGRATTLPAWMTKAGANAPPAAPVDARPPPPAGPPPRAGQFDDAPEPPVARNDLGEPSGGKRRSRSRDRGNGRSGGDFRGPPPDRPRSRDRGNGRDRDYRGYENGADRRREDSYRRGPPRGRSRSRSRSRSRDRRDYRGDYSRRGDRYEDRGYSARGPRDDNYRGRPMRREEEAMERGYRRAPPNGHDDRTSRRYASDYQP